MTPKVIPIVDVFWNWLEAQMVGRLASSIPSCVQVVFGVDDVA
jgi:hypothetical protein